MAKQITTTSFSSFVIITVSALLLGSCSNGKMWLHQNALENVAERNSTQSIMQWDRSSPSPELKYETVGDEQVAISALNLNNQGNQITVKPSMTIQASTHYNYHCPTCAPDLNNQIIVGLAGRSAQACIYNGGIQGEGSADFSLRVPAKPGKYEVRYRAIQAADCAEALKVGWNAETSPSQASTIGKITVSRKVEEMNGASPS